MVEAKSPGASGPRSAARAFGEIARGDALQVKPGQEFLDRLGAPEIGRQECRGEANPRPRLAGASVAHPGTAHRNRTNAGLDLALRQIPVPYDPPPARRIRQIGVPLDESRHLHLNRLCQKTLRAKAQNLRQWIL